jgi:hypothetical protein
MIFAELGNEAQGFRIDGGSQAVKITDVHPGRRDVTGGG